MPRSTLQDAQNSRIPVSLNILATDARFVQYLNAACQRLVAKGHYVGTVQNYSVLASSQNISGQSFTLPPQFATIEGFAVGRNPTAIRPLWYLYNGNGMGVVRSSDTYCSASQAIHIGNVCTFKDIPSGGGRKLRFQCDLASDVGKTVVAIGLDDSGNFIRSSQSGSIQDGESIVLSQSPGTLSTNDFSKLADVQLTRRDGQVWCYSWDGVTNTLIGQYLHWDTRPSYRRYVIPSLVGSTTTDPVLDIAGKMNFIPVSQANDYLSIGNLEAVRLAAMAVKREEENLFGDAATLLALARQVLDDELTHFEGDAFAPSIQITGPDGIPCPVPALL